MIDMSMSWTRPGAVEIWVWWYLTLQELDRLAMLPCLRCIRQDFDIKSCNACCLVKFSDRY